MIGAAISLILGYALFCYWNRMVMLSRFEQPLVIRNPVTGILLAVLWFSLLAYSVVSTFRASRFAGVVLALALLALVHWQRVKHGPAGMERRIEAAWVRLKESNPRMSDEEICAAIIKEFFPDCQEDTVRRVAREGDLSRVKAFLIGAFHGT